MKTSETVKEIIPALIAARASIGTIVKTAENDFIKNKGKAFKYAPLDVVLEAVLPALAEQGLFLSQDNLPTSTIDLMTIETTIYHSSGEFAKWTHEVCMGKKDPQGSGSCHTYGKRYALNGIFGLCAKNEDDDANAAMPTKDAPEAPKPTKINGSRMIEGSSGGMVLAPEAQANINETMNAFENFCKLAKLNKRQIAILFNDKTSVPSYPSEEKAAQLLEAVTDFIERKESGNLTEYELNIIGA